MDTALLALPIDLGHALGVADGRAWVGMTAATGRRYQEHHIIGWQFCEGQGGCAQPMGFCEAFGCNAEYPSPAFGHSGSLGRYAELERGVPHLSHPAPVPTEGIDTEGSPEMSIPRTAGLYADADAAVEYGDELGLEGEEDISAKDVLEVRPDVETPGRKVQGGLKLELPKVDYKSL